MKSLVIILTSKNTKCRHRLQVWLQHVRRFQYLQKKCCLSRSISPQTPTDACQRCWYCSRLPWRMVLSNCPDKGGVLSHGYWKCNVWQGLPPGLKNVQRSHRWCMPTLPIDQRTLWPYIAATWSTNNKIITSLGHVAVSFWSTENGHYYFSVFNLLVH